MFPSTMSSGFAGLTTMVGSRAYFPCEEDWTLRLTFGPNTTGIGEGFAPAREADIGVNALRTAATDTATPTRGRWTRMATSLGESQLAIRDCWSINYGDP